jgi:DNA-binding NarL/FixJ family response regulator
VEELAQRWRVTARQRDVLLAVARGESNKGIASALRCAESTVEAHVAALCERSGCSGRSALAARVWTEPS